LLGEALKGEALQPTRRALTAFGPRNAPEAQPGLHVGAHCAAPQQRALQDGGADVANLLRRGRVAV
jgi:hypothetical protein